MNNKSIIRKSIIAERNIKSYNATDILLNIFVNNFSWQKAENFALYYPFKSEISPLKIAEFLQKHGKTTLLPRIEGESLKFYPWKIDDELIANNYGILEPVSTIIISPDIAIIPMLACDAKGNRLGYGGGFYDKTFTKNKPYIIGTCYDFQILPKIIHNKYDVKINAILTDRKLYYI